MASPDLWPLTYRERERFADLLATLRPDDWSTPSVAAGWSVRDVVAHCISTAHTTPASFVTGFAGAGFNFGKFAEKNIAKYRSRSPDELVAETRASAGRTSAPPGPPQVPLSEIVVHSEDVARPLGRSLDRAPEALVASLDFYKGAQPLIGGSLLMALSGRRAGLADLDGDGLPTLASRMP